MGAENLGLGKGVQGICFVAMEYHPIGALLFYMYVCMHVYFVVVLVRVA